MTANPWAFLRNLAVDKLPQPEDKAALAYIDQAFDFFEAAHNPHLGSKPLLYYYSFLNLVKAALLVRKIKIPPAVHHGICDPQANTKQRLRLEGQKVRILPVATDHSEVFPELVGVLGGNACQQRDIKVVALLAQVPSVHRTYTRVKKEDPRYLPLSRVELRLGRGQVWARMAFKDPDKDVQATLPAFRTQRGFHSFARQVASEEKGEMCFETDPVPGRKRGVDRAIKTLSGKFRERGASSILTSTGYRFYFCTLPKRERLPQLAAAYAVMFYLGSVTRYKPDVFDKIVAGGYAWIVEEFLATQPTQFIYTLASELAGVDVVRPYAAFE